MILNHNQTESFTDIFYKDKGFYRIRDNYNMGEHAKGWETRSKTWKVVAPTELSQWQD